MTYITFLMILTYTIGTDYEFPELNRGYRISTFLDEILMTKKQTIPAKNFPNEHFDSSKTPSAPPSSVILFTIYF